MLQKPIPFGMELAVLQELWGDPPYVPNRVARKNGKETRGTIEDG